jgi:hypothetical protein
MEVFSREREGGGERERERKREKGLCVKRTINVNPMKYEAVLKKTKNRIEIISLHCNLNFLNHF